jgi:hypothetical protein
LLVIILHRDLLIGMFHTCIFARVGTLLHGTDHPAVTSGVFISGKTSKPRCFIGARISFAWCPCLRYCSLWHGCYGNKMTQASFFRICISPCFFFTCFLCSYFFFPREVSQRFCALIYFTTLSNKLYPLLVSKDTTLRMMDSKRHS